MVLRVAVVGAGAAGMSAASRVKRLLGDRAEVVVFDKGRWVSFALCGTPYYIGFVVKELEDLVYYPITEFTEKRKIRIRLGAEVTRIDAGDRRLYYRSKGGLESYEYDYLVLATGAEPKIPKAWAEYMGYENMFTLHSLDEADEIRKYMASSSIKRVVIVGAGYIGYEVADNLRLLGKRVTMVEALDRVLPAMLDKDIAEEARRPLENNGVELRLESPVKSFEAEGNKVRRVILENGEAIEADAFIVAVGIKPSVRLAEDIGLRIGETGAIWVNERMQTSKEEIYAVGDAVETTDLVTGRRIWLPLAPAANKMGFVAGTNIAGGYAVFPGVVRTSVTGAFGTIVAATGLREEEAAKYGFNPVAAKLEAGTKAHYIRGGRRIVLKVVADKDTGRLLGAQAVGDETAFWRINVIAALLAKKATVWDLFNTDIGYMPLVAPAWDPLIIAARLLMRHVGTMPRKD
ncbi:MAG: FAD-dependent oxidoreductase [Pyrodictiaceae archaeon]